MLTHVATGYGRQALETLRGVVAEAKRDDPMAPVVVLAPHHVAATVARRHLARYAGDAGKTQGIAGIDVTVMTRFAERVAAAALAPRRPLTRQRLAMAWRQALLTEAGVFADVAEHPSAVRALVVAHRELRYLAPDELDRVAAAGSISADVVRLHRAVASALEAGWYDERDLLDAASSRLRVAGVDATVVLYLPQDLTRSELSVVEALSATNGLVIIEGMTGAQRADDRGRRWPASDRADTTSAIPVPTATRVLNASDSDDEVRCVVRDVVRALQTTAADRVAVLYTAADPYARLLHEQFAAAGIRVNGSGSRPVIERALSRALLGLLALIDDDLPRGALFRTLADAPVRDYENRRIPISLWERVSREAGVLRGEDWTIRLNRYATMEQAKAEAAGAQGNAGAVAGSVRRSEAAQQLANFVGRLRDELNRASSMNTWSDLSTWCQDLIASLFGAGKDLTRVPLEEQHAAARIMTVLGGLHGLDDGGASLRTLRDVLESELSMAVPRVGRFGDGVLVAPVSEAVGLDADLVHVVGLSEDLYPGRVGGDALLPDRVRETTDALRTSRDDLNRAYRQLLAAFAAASDVVASFPRGDLRSSARRLPSRWLLGTLRDLSGDHLLPATDWHVVGELSDALVTSESFAGELLRTSDPATGQEWRTRRTLGGGLEDPVADLARAMLDARAGSRFTRFDGNLTGVHGLPDFREATRRLAPTALEAYVSCPHSFFVEHLLRVRPLEQPEDIVTISPAEIGLLIHRAIDQLVRECGDDLPGHGEPWPAHRRARLVEIARGLAAEAEASGVTGHPRLWRHERDRIETDLIEMLDLDDRWRAQHNARVVASELRFGYEDEPPVEVPVPGGVVRMRGSADKVDIDLDGTVYVTDIKTGRRTSFAAISQDDPLASASKLQLPVYGLAARSRFGSPTSTVRAEYWFVRKDPGRIGVDLTPLVEQELSTVIEVLVRSIAAGLFPPRPPETADYAFVQCHYCNPDGVSHATNRDRWERQRHDSILRELVDLIEPGMLPPITESPS
jgi:ATP-dependent helicase/nuclease subunit B